jgi:L,D-transpeptidase catalytic domain
LCFSCIAAMFQHALSRSQASLTAPGLADGPDNPLGARAIYLGSTIYLIHGTNEPSSIGKAASSGCIRMLNEDVSELYQFVKLLEATRGLTVAEVPPLERKRRQPGLATTDEEFVSWHQLVWVIQGPQVHFDFVCAA